jgi:hypothetical protein
MEENMQIDEELCKHLLHHLGEVYLIECVDHLKKIMWRPYSIPN